MKRMALILPILAGIMFGSVGIFVRKLTYAGFTNTTVIFSRALPAVIIMLVFILIKDRSLFKMERKNIKWLVCCAVIGMLGTNMTFNISSTNLSLAFAAVLAGIAPVYALIISSFVFHEKITRRKVICIAMSIIGCVLVSGVIGTQLTLSAIGLTAGIISGLTYGLYSIFSKIGTDGGLNSFTIIFYSLLIITIVLIPFTDYDVILAFIKDAPASNLTFMFAHTMFVGVLPYLLISLALEYIEPGLVTILATCEPVAAMLFGVILFSEIPTVFSIIGLCLTVTALALISVKDKDDKLPDNIKT